MSKNKLSSLFAKTASLPSVEEMMQRSGTEAAETEGPPTPAQEAAEPSSASLKRYQTGAGAATYTTRLEEQLKKAISEQAAIRILVDLIDPNPWQPRIKFDQEALKTLASSIAMGGVMAPIAVRRNPDNPERYQLIAGERRWRATKLAEKTEIPAVLLELSNADTAANALAENLLRENLTDYEISRAMKAMEDQFPNKALMCDTFGVSRTQLYRLLSFAQLPKFMLDALDAEPGLLGTKNLEDLLNLFKDWKDRQSELELLVKPILAKRYKGLLNQVDFVKEVSKALTPTQPRVHSSRNRQVLMKEGKRVGTLVRDNEVLSLKLKLSDIPAAQQYDLLTYLQSQFNMKT